VALVQFGKHSKSSSESQQNAVLDDKGDSLEQIRCFATVSQNISQSAAELNAE